VRWRWSTAGGGSTATRVLLVVEEGGGKDDEGGDVERGEYGRCNAATSKTSGGGLLSATTRISRSRLLGIEGGRRARERRNTGLKMTGGKGKLTRGHAMSHVNLILVHVYLTEF
jgi:hypothetical protein